MTKATMQPDSKKAMARFVAENLAHGAKLLITITHASRSNMSYRYKVAMAYTDKNGAVQVAYLNYWMAAELGISLNADNELRGNGCGFDRRHDAAYTVGTILGNYGLIEEFGFGRSLDVANSQYWQAI